jgi:hypothetical protein
VRILTLIIIVWLVIGAIAGGQRHYYGGNNAGCVRLGTIAATIAAGPLNYVGVNPKITCRLPQPSK